ncbi:MAG: tetratricopeptide repeat protein [Acidobacteriota bacterium]
MALKRSKISQSADQLTRQGKLKAAIREYEKLLAEKPDDPGILNKVGDLCGRLGDTERALVCFRQIAQRYRDRGFAQKAIAMYKKVARLDRSDIQVREQLAALHLDLGLVREAQENLREAARLFAGQDQMQRAMELEYRAVELRSDDWVGLQDLAGRLADPGQIEPAVATYLRAAEGFAGSGKGKNALKCARRALALAPLDPAPAAFLCRHLLAAGEAPRAVAEMEQLHKETPEAAHLQALLGRALLETDQLEAARSAFQAARESTYFREDWACQAALVKLDLRQNRVEEALQGLDRLLSRVDREGTPGPGLDLLRQCLAALPSCQVILDQLLTRTLRADPTEPSTEPALDDLSRILPQSGRADRLPEVLYRLSLCRPEDLELRQRVEEMGTPVVNAGPEKKARPVPAVKSAAVAAPAGNPSEVDEEFISEHLTEADVFIKYRLWEKAAAQLVLIIERFPLTIVAHQRLVDLYREMGERTLAIRQALALADACHRRGAVGEAVKAISDALSQAPENPLLLSARAALGKGRPLDEILASSSQAGEPSRADKDGGRLDEAMHQVETAFPGTPAQAAEEEVIEISFDGPDPIPEPSPVAASSKVEPSPEEPQTGSAGHGPGSHESRDSSGEGFFDLAGALEQEMAEEQAAASVLPVVDDGMADRGDSVEGIQRAIQDQVGAEDHQTHYQLGIAFKEMGLLDSSIGEFQQASRDPENFLACCSMLGLCFREKGMPQIAEKWYQRGLEKTASSGTDNDHRLGLLYDLGELMIERDDLPRALELFTEVYATDAGYRQVARRMNELNEKMAEAGPSQSASRL